eukprot:330305_1
MSHVVGLSPPIPSVSGGYFLFGSFPPHLDHQFHTHLKKLDKCLLIQSFNWMRSIQYTDMSQILSTYLFVLCAKADDVFGHKCLEYSLMIFVFDTPNGGFTTNIVLFLCTWLPIVLM